MAATSDVTERVEVSTAALYPAPEVGGEGEMTVEPAPGQELNAAYICHGHLRANTLLPPRQISQLCTFKHLLPNFISSFFFNRFLQDIFVLLNRQ